MSFVNKMKKTKRIADNRAGSGSSDSHVATICQRFSAFPIISDQSADYPSETEDLGVNEANESKTVLFTLEALFVSNKQQLKA